MMACCNVFGMSMKREITGGMLDESSIFTPLKSPHTLKSSAERFIGKVLCD